jgi:hypothetical protein
MRPSTSKAVGYLLGELCAKFGLCSASRSASKFESLVEAGPARFTLQVFIAEGIHPTDDPALAKAVENHVSAVLKRWEESDAV